MIDRVIIRLRTSHSICVKDRKPDYLLMLILILMLLRTTTAMKMMPSVTKWLGSQTKENLVGHATASADSLAKLRHPNIQTNCWPMMMGMFKSNKEKKTKDVYLYFFLPQWLEVNGRVFDIEGLCQQMFLFSNKINLSIFWWFAH